MKTLTILICLFLTVTPSVIADWNLEEQEILRWRGQYYDLASDGHYLYLACKRGVEIYDIDNPDTPILAGSFLTDGLANGVAINYPYLYVGDVYGFNIWDVSDLSAPAKLGGFKRSGTEGYQERLTYRDGFVFVAAYSSGLQIIDVSDPFRPVIVSQVDTPAYSWDLALKENAAFMMDFFSIEIMDISYLFAPLKRTSFEAIFAGGIVVDESFAYIAYVDGLLVLDISNPFSPVVISDIGPTGAGAAESVAIKDNYVILAHQSYVEIYDVSDPSEPLQVSFFYPPGHPRKCLAVENHLYTILDDNGFHVTDITHPEYPVTGQHINPGEWGSRQDVVIDNNRLYLCDWNRGLVVYDISDPESIVESGSYQSPGNLNDIKIKDNLAFLSCYTELQIVDVENPSDIHYVSNYKTTGNPWDVDISGNFAYLCDLYTFQILDISNPSSITRLGVLYLAQNGTSYRCKVSGNIAYIAYGWGGLLMVDISNPASPEILGSWPGDTSKSISTVKLDGSILFALTPSSGIDILNVSDPLQPQLIGNISVPDTQITDFEMDSEYIYCSGSNKGIFVFQRSSNSEYPLVARADTPGDAVGITADTQRIYVADDYDLAVFRREHFGPDTSPPVSVITFPEEGSIQYGKSIPVKGSATDSGSGVRFVEVSIDDGMSWNQALGQDAWSYLLKGLEPGYIRLQTRAVDWFGNSGQESPPVTFSWRPDRPVISLAGFLNAHVSESGEKLFTIAALIIDAYDPGYIRNVELYYNGEPTGMFLERNGVSDNFIYYTLELTYETYNDDMLAYSLVATDVYNNSSIMWPLLSVRSN